jgi:hypothetical protein
LLRESGLAIVLPREAAMAEGERRQHEAACHCGRVRFRVRLTDGFRTVRRCSCSYCRMRGAVAVSAQLGDIEFVSGEENLSVYRFNTGVAKHYFCRTCGIHTHHQRRSNPEQFGVNVACIEGVGPFDFPAVPVMDGVAHPSDTASGPRATPAQRSELTRASGLNPKWATQLSTPRSRWVRAPLPVRGFWQRGG